MMNLTRKTPPTKDNGITTAYILDVTSVENPVLTGYLSHRLAAEEVERFAIEP